MTTHSPAVIVREYLVAQSLFTRPADCDAWPIFKQFMPDDDTSEVPDNLGAIYDTTGFQDGRFMSGQIINHFGIQISVRAGQREHDAGWEKAQAIETALQAVFNATVVLEDTLGNEKTYTLQNLSQQGPILSVGLDSKSTRRRWQFNINLLATIQESP